MANINCGHCHSTHASVAEVRACSTRKTERPSTSGARKPARRSARPAVQFPENPWFQLHLDAEMDYSRHLGRRAVTAMVIREFAQSGYEDKAMTCGNCGHDAAWFRPTVGAVMCIGCRSVRVGRHNKETDKVEIVWTKGS